MLNLRSSIRQLEPDHAVPHLILEYSANIEAEFDLDGLLDELRDRALQTGVFPVGGLRIRAMRMDRYRIADCHPDNAYVHLTAWIGHGRPLDVRQRAGEAIFGVLSDRLTPLYERRPLAMSFNIQEFHPQLNFKKNNLHVFVKQRASEGNGSVD